MSLQHAVLGSHVLLILALAAGIAVPATVPRLVVAALVLLPLLLALPAVGGGRGHSPRRLTVLRRLAVLLVAYIGGASVEVVARAGDALPFSVALLAAALELGLLLALIRRPAAPE